MSSYLLSSICSQIGITFEGMDSTIEGIHTLSEANESQLSFFNSAKYTAQLPLTRAKAVLIESKYAPLLPPSTIALITDEPYLKLALASALFAPKISTETTPAILGNDCDIDKSVIFGKNIIIGNGVTILGGTYLGDNVTIGDNTLIYANVSIYHDTLIGAKCIIHSGTVIGSDGYGFAHTRMGEHVKIYQNGNVIIEDSVEIGANCSIDRAVFGSTLIGKGSKFDNLVQIGHNCVIGEHTLLAGQVGLAGSTTTGRNVVMGGQSGSAGHLHIGDFTQVAGKGGVTKSLEAKKTYAGFPAIEHRIWLKLQAKIHGLLKK